MYYLVESSKSFSEVIFDLEPVVQRLGFVVLQTQDLGDTLRRREIDFDEECQVVDIGNYRFLETALTLDLRLALTLPWRIAVYTENGATKLGALRPSGWLGEASASPALTRWAREVEEKIVQIIDETR